MRLAFVSILVISFAFLFWKSDAVVLTDDTDNAEPEVVEADPMAPPDFQFPKLRYVSRKPKYNYAESVAKSLLFYEAQRSGMLPPDQRVTWRKDSALFDGEDNGVDLSGGYYDGAGYVKYGFPQAAMITLLSWGAIRYRRTYETIGQWNHMLDCIKWATDYFIKCHTGPTEYYAQVGNKAADRQFQAAPQEMTADNYRRISYKIDENNPGSDLAAETAAALAAASIVFQPIDPAYSMELLRHAEELYDFADKFRGSYSKSVAPAEQSYRSSLKELRDELVWGAAWLYRRTGKKSYLKKAQDGYQRAKIGHLAKEFSWSDKKAGIQLLMAEITRKDKYRMHVEWFCQYSTTEISNMFGVQSTHTAGGLLFISEWGPLRYAANTAFICAIAADLNISPISSRKLAETQINYMLGSNGRSYQIGFGNDYPTHAYHKSSYCPLPPQKCPRFDDKIPNTFTLYGALIGGPSADDVYHDQRSNEKQNSVTLDFNAGFQSCVVSLLDFYIYGDKIRPHYDRPGSITLDAVDLPAPKVLTQKELNEQSTPDYTDILQKSLLFFEAQRSGLLTTDKKIPWRGDSGLDDGKDIGKELSGGYYDGFTNVKFGFPLSFSMTLLSWSVIEFPTALRDSKVYFNTIDALDWGIQYIRKTHVDMYETVAQIGDPHTEKWVRPDQMSDRRLTYVVSNENPGTDFTAEMAASLAAASVATQGLEVDGVNEMCLRAQFIFDNMTLKADPTLYHESVPSAADFYRSSGFADEIEWAALWLYRCSGRDFYKNMLSTNDQIPETFSWNEKQSGVNLLKAIEFNNGDMIAPFCDYLLFKAPRTPAGLLFLDEVQPSKHAAGAAFILALAFEYFPEHKNAEKWRDLARNQISYLSGIRTGQSFIVGYGELWPLQPQHIGSSCPSPIYPCGEEYKERNQPNPQSLTGALVGGPDAQDRFEDNRMNNNQNRVSLDTNAVLYAAVSALRHLEFNNNLYSSESYAPPLHCSVTVTLLMILISTLMILDLKFY